MRTYNVGEFAEEVGVCQQTLRRWDKAGRLVPGRTPGNRRIYTEEDLHKALGRKPGTQGAETNA
jgi:DNA-binding transcriptional MerR regulator